MAYNKGNNYNRNNRYNRGPRRPRIPEFVLQNISAIDYKQVEKLLWFIDEQGAIRPRRQTGLTAKQQRRVTQAIKRARTLALLSHVSNKHVE